ncbi:MAG: mannose-1-phosphate guanylyltransferase/mannose-6-phosphate isomerase [Betaproteobacteria bacterium]
MHTIVPVVIAGGSGTRLWPLSRALYPKQFLALGGRHTLFQEAVQRLAALAGEDIGAAGLCVVCNEEHRFLVRDQLREIGQHEAALLLEPAGRNTAPALTFAALHASAEGADPILVVSPADQTMTRPEAFVAAARSAVRAASDGSLVTLGIVPNAPETGYGYIRCADAADDRASDVERFVEKPDRVTAERYLAEGGYYWNSGMFVVRASTWLAAIRAFRPDIAEATQRAFAGRHADNGFVRPEREAFFDVPSESIDYAVMEPAAAHRDAGIAVRMVTLDAGWSDLGAWDAVWGVSERDDAGNAAQGDVLFEGSRNTLVHATSRLVGAVGVENLVIVETPDAVLVADRSRSQEVKRVVARLAKDGRSEGDIHRRVHRPWGWYDSIDAGPRFQVKRILVNPGASLSLQMHHHRAEHWVVVRGTAEVTCGEKKLLLGENQSTYIPLGETHRLANPGKVPLEIIEVQSGAYLGEDDIVRFEDHYGRSG